jgi:hypothetical protein
MTISFIELHSDPCFIRVFLIRAKLHSNVINQTLFEKVDVCWKFACLTLDPITCISLSVTTKTNQVI